MSLLQEASGQMAYLKAGLYGIAGSGKTFTASTIAVGLSQLLNSDKPIAMADTETGSDFVRPRIFDPAGKKLIVAKTRAFSDLLAIVDEAERECDVLIIDSISHFHDELVDSYLKKNQLTRLRLKDWQPIKQTWRDFSTRFVSSKLHILLCGRSGDVWEEKEDPEDGSTELKKVGTKMRAEREISYEPSLLIEMEAVFASARVGSNMIRRAFVKKDRFDVIDGKHFDNPTIADFMPHICLLNIGGEHKAIEKDRTSEEMFTRGDSGAQRAQKTEVELEKITAAMREFYPSPSASADIIGRQHLMKDYFNTTSWTEITRLPLPLLISGREALEEAVANKNKGAAEAPAEPTNGTGKTKTKGARA